MSDYPTYDTRYGQPIYKDGCGIFGIIRKDGAPKVSNLDTLTGIACIKYRGSDLGAGFALFDPSLSNGGQTHKVKAFVRNQKIADNLQDQLAATVNSPRDVQLLVPDAVVGRERFGIWEGNVSTSDDHGAGEDHRQHQRRAPLRRQDRRPRLLVRQVPRRLQGGRVPARCGKGIPPRQGHQARGRLDRPHEAADQLSRTLPHLVAPVRLDGHAPSRTTATSAPSERTSSSSTPGAFAAT